MAAYWDCQMAEMRQKVTQMVGYSVDVRANNRWHFENRLPISISVKYSQVKKWMSKQKLKY